MGYTLDFIRAKLLIDNGPYYIVALHVDKDSLKSNENVGGGRVKRIVGQAVSATFKKELSLAVLRRFSDCGQSNLAGMQDNT